MIRLSDLLGADVVTRGGEKLGSVHDLRLRRDSDEGVEGPWHLAGLVVGPRGVFERLGIFGAKRPEPVGEAEVVEWAEVVAVEDGRVVVARRG